jgi:hypothetical protein
MKTERDAGLKSRAYLSLTEVTGQSYPPDAPEWPPYLRVNDSPAPVAPTGNSGIQPVGFVRPQPVAGPASAPPANGWTQPPSNPQTPRY